jgi:hypothetical protein
LGIELITQKAGYTSSDALGTGISSVRSNVLRIATASAMTLLLTIIWCLVHRYMGMSRDAQVYAVQALSRIEPALAGDLFFQHTSQDQFTVFSGFYAAFIRVFGLANAAVALTVVFTVWFYSAAWALARNLFSRDLAWLALVMPLVTTGAYGGFNVFHYTEEFLTARLPAEALIVTGLACYFSGRRALGLAFASSALLVHPLIALPGVLLIIGLWLPLRLTLSGAGLGCLSALLVALLATVNAHVGHLLKVMDPEWTGIVIERSEFLLPSYWPLDDWILNLRGFLCLGVTATLVSDQRIRRLCLVAAAVAASGIAIACIGSMIGPIGIIMQGQAWRWVWVGTFLSVLLLVPTAFLVWRDDKCGPLCSILLVSAWTFPPVDGTACATLALAIWLARHRFSARTAELLRLAAAALGVVIAVWIASNVWTLTTSSFDTGRESRLLQWGRNVGGLQIPIVLIAVAAWYGLRNSRALALPAIAVAFLLAAAIAIIPPTFTEIDKVVYTDRNESFADWQSRIPPTSTVFILREGDTGTFAWLTLRRANYLSMDQSAGVVFSRETALEVKRRSEVLLPVKDPDWKVHSYILWHQKWQKTNNGKDSPSRIRPLTAEKLAGLCRDPILGFVIAKQNVGFEAIRHPQKGYWKDWYLYDCNVVRTWNPSA